MVYQLKGSTCVRCLGRSSFIRRGKAIQLRPPGPLRDLTDTFGHNNNDAFLARDALHPKVNDRVTPRSPAFLIDNADAGPPTPRSSTARAKKKKHKKKTPRVECDRQNGLGQRCRLQKGQPTVRRPSPPAITSLFPLSVPFGCFFLHALGTMARKGTEVAAQEKCSRLRTEPFAVTRPCSFASRHSYASESGDQCKSGSSQVKAYSSARNASQVRGRPAKAPARARTLCSLSCKRVDYAFAF